MRFKRSLFKSWPFFLRPKVQIKRQARLLAFFDLLFLSIF